MSRDSALDPCLDLEGELREALIKIRDHGKRIMRLEARVTELEGYGIKGIVRGDGKITWDRPRVR